MATEENRTKEAHRFGKYTLIDRIALNNPVTRGLEAIAVGFSLRYPDDEANLEVQFEVYDSLYAWCRLQVARGQ